MGNGTIDLRLSEVTEEENSHMKDFKTMSESELAKTLNSAQAELQWRENAKRAFDDIVAVAKKYGFTKADLPSLISSQRGTKPRGSKKRQGLPVATEGNKIYVKAPKTKTRKPVKAKYFGRQEGQKWTGRGRAPGWVTEICELENISLEEFKFDARFKVSKGPPVDDTPNSTASPSSDTASE